MAKTLKWSETSLASPAEGIRRFREALGTNADFRRFVLLLLGVLTVWSVGYWMAGEAETERQRSLLQEDRFQKFLDVVSQYRALGSAPAIQAASETAKDPLGAFSGVAERLGMKDRIKDLSASDQGVVVALENLYAEELMTLFQELSAAGLTVRSAELRTLPGKEGALFAVSLIVGAES